MKGTALIYRPGASDPEVQELAAPPTLEFLQAAVGGYIELVPMFETIVHAGERRRCRALCNEEGKLDQLPVNITATRLWHAALPDPGLRRPDGSPADVLVGPIVILYGDRDFMAEL